MPYPVDDGKIVSESFEIDDRQLISQILNGDSLLAGNFLQQKCIRTFDYLNNTRLKDLDLQVDDLINDFYLYLYDNNWEKLRSFRYESKLSTWINVVASRYLLKKYGRELKEKTVKKTPIEDISISQVIDETHNVVRAELLEAIGCLKEKRAQLVLLLILQGYDSHEIGKQLGTTANNVYTIKFRAVNKLRTLLDE